MYFHRNVNLLYVAKTYFYKQKYLLHLKQKKSRVRKRQQKEEVHLILLKNIIVIIERKSKDI